MELKARILVIISISSLILLYLSVEGLSILPIPSIVQPNSKFKFDEPKDQGLPNQAASPPFLLGLDEAKETPISSPDSLIFIGKTVAAPASSSLLPESEISLSPEAIAPAAVASYRDASPSSSSPAPGSSTLSEISSSLEAMTPTIAQAPSGFIDQDIALAIEARIKQSQSDSQVAMEEAKKLLKEDPNIASSETGKCLSKCVDKYAASLNELSRAITDLGIRDVTLLADDFGAVETDILSCQACFKDKVGEDSPFKALEEATTKAARECLTVMDYAVV
ncbi:unnamed protein product [Lactuca saligna]|uniref:Pectinesterase inhibitor domain-containing protein n=1 Tax=Lactuca saligna TaxID=75948 RepID=A0AA35ZWW8_LACSI|nr:unnamed protein product [Lactuca saligna]